MGRKGTKGALIKPTINTVASIECLALHLREPRTENTGNCKGFIIANSIKTGGPALLPDEDRAASEQEGSHQL